MLTKAITMSTRSRGPQASAVMGVVVLAIAITTLLLLHVNLQLRIADMQREIRTLQVKRDDVYKNELSRLRTDIETMKQEGRALQFARQNLKMDDVKPGEAKTLTISPARVEAWRICRPEAGITRPALSHQEIALRQVQSKAESFEGLLKILQTPVAQTQ